MTTCGQLVISCHSVVTAYTVYFEFSQMVSTSRKSQLFVVNRHCYQDCIGILQYIAVTCGKGDNTRQVSLSSSMPYAHCRCSLGSSLGDDDIGTMGSAMAS